jgi:SLBB domain
MIDNMTDATAQKKFSCRACGGESQWNLACLLIIFVLLAILVGGCASENSRTSPTQFTADNSSTLLVKERERVETSDNSTLIGCIWVKGAVRAPGRYLLTERMTVADAVFAAGGPNDYKVQISHPDGKIAIVRYPATVFYVDILRNGDKLYVTRPIFPEQ